MAVQEKLLLSFPSFEQPDQDQDDTGDEKEPQEPAKKGPGGKQRDYEQQDKNNPN